MAVGCRHALGVILLQKAHQGPINDCVTLRPSLDEAVPGGRSELKIAQRFNATTEAIVGHTCRLPDRKISSGALAYNAPRIRQRHYGRSIIRVERDAGINDPGYNVYGDASRASCV